MCEKTNYKTSNPRIDRCIRKLIKFLNRPHGQDYISVASCCGHNKYPLTIVVKKFEITNPVYYELLTNTKIPRTRNFYKRDKEGYYYIPEVTN